MNFLKKILKKISKIGKKKYLSCPLLEHAFMFDQNNCLRVCSTVTETEGGRPLLKKDYNGEIINWKKIFAQKRQHRNLHKAGKILDECKGCNFLREQEWDNKDYIDELLITHWVDCNSNCVYCPVVNNEGLKRTTFHYNIVPALKDAISKNVIKKDALIELAGGESTIHPEFEELISILLQANFTNIVVNTSGIKFSEKIEEGIKKGQIKVVCSVDSGKKETHETIKRKNSYESVWDTLTRYSTANLNLDRIDAVRTKYIVIPEINDNMEEFCAFLNKNKEAGVKAVAINLEIDWYQQNHEKDTTDLKTLLFKMEESALEEKMHCKIYPQAQWIMRK